MADKKRISKLIELVLCASLPVMLSGMTFYNKPDYSQCKTSNLQINPQQRIEYTRCSNGRQNAKEYVRNILEFELIDLVGDGVVDIIVYHNPRRNSERLTRDKDYEFARGSFDHGDAIMKRLMKQYRVGGYFNIF